MNASHYETMIPKAPYSVIVDTWALKRLPYHHFGVYVYTTELHGAFGNVTLEANMKPSTTSL